MKTIFMPKLVWEKWDAALRSGEYEQGKNFLRVDTEEGPTYCCLGVLQQCLTGCVEKMSRDIATGDWKYDALPTREWLEDHKISFMSSIANEDNNPHIVAKQMSIAELNDTGMSFVEIADLIKEAVEFTDA